MTQKIYRTAQGKTVDLGALQLQNENIRAVGNMKVNARGDLIDSHNRTIDSRNQQVSKQYRRQVTNVTNSPVKKNTQISVGSQIPVPEKTESVQPLTNTNSSIDTNKESTGLAAAIARARQIKQEPLKTVEDLMKENTGIKKI